MEDIMPTRTRKPFFDRMKQGLSEALQHERGQMTLRSTEFPEPRPKSTPPPSRPSA